MAHGFGNALKSEQYNFFSAGTKKHGLNPNAVKVMADVGIDISHHESNTVDELGGQTMDYVITVCSDAHETCPIFPGGKIIHVGFDDPPRLAKEMDEEQGLAVYARVRDEIKQMVQELEVVLEK
jgi:arsenate reductase